MLHINQVLESLLNRGFRAPKCKTLLKLASSRINVLRNKRSIHLKQLRKELAKLLGNGQDAAAQIKVEHIIREQNMLRVYDKLDIFCELLIIRMPIIESQRECPVDLQEAIASLIFAAPRVSDLPELLEIQQMLSSKYGPEFTAAAAGLRPDCHVNRLIIEILSAQAPSLKVKLNVMKEVAEEYGVEWDVTNFELENSNESQELLDGNGTENFFKPIQMLPIPLHWMSNKSEVGSSLREESHPPSTQGNVNFQQSSGLMDPKFVPFSAADSNRFYSPPRESSVTQRSDLLEDTLLQRTHSRTKSEGSINLQDIIDAAEAAAESAERAAQAARTAAEIARLRICSRPEKRQEGIISMNPTIVGNELHPSVSELENTGDDGPKDKARNVDPSCKHGLVSGLSQQSSMDEEKEAHQNVLNEKLNVDAVADNYDWTETRGSKESGPPFEEDVSGKNHAVNVFWKNEEASIVDKNKPNVHMEVDDYDWTPQDRAAHNIDDGQRVSHDPVDTNPFWKKGAHPLTDDAASRFGNYEDNRVDSLPKYDEPRFDDSRSGSFQEPVQRSQSLEEDSYYTYPNLFSTSSHN